MKNIYRYKDWNKADLENYKLNNKRTSIKRLYSLIESMFEYQESYGKEDLIIFSDNDPSFEFEINIKENNYLKSGKYTIGYNLEFNPNDDDSYREYYLIYNDGIAVENSHKQIPFIMKSIKKIFNFKE